MLLDIILLLLFPSVYNCNALALQHLQLHCSIDNSILLCNVPRQHVHPSTKTHIHTLTRRTLHFVIQRVHRSSQLPLQFPILCSSSAMLMLCQCQAKSVASPKHKRPPLMTSLLWNMHCLLCRGILRLPFVVLFVVNAHSNISATSTQDAIPLPNRVFRFSFSFRKCTIV